MKPDTDLGAGPAILVAIVSDDLDAGWEITRSLDRSELITAVFFLGVAAARLLCQDAQATGLDPTNAAVAFVADARAAAERRQS